MAVTVKLPTPFRRHAGQARSVQVEAATVEEALAGLADQFPAMRQSLYAGDGSIKPFLRIFVGERDIAGLSGLETRLQDGDVISIIPPVAGA